MTITSLGVGSNLDLTTLLTQLQTAESQPLVDLQTQQTSYTTKLTAYGQLSSALGVLQSTAAALGSSSLYQSVQATSSNTGVLSATAGSTAVAGTYAVNVTQLAQSQALVTAGQASATTAIGNGTITIDFGSISGGTLNAATGTYTGATFNKDASRTAVPITIGASNNTLQGIRDAINGANAGVTATIVNDGSGTPQRLVLASTQTGAASSMRISVTGDLALQNLLANDPAGTQNLTQTVSGQDAKMTVNGIAVSSSSNTVKEAIQGTTLNVQSVGAAAISLSTNTSAVSSAISAFVQAYNNLHSTASSLSAYDASTKTASPLTGDATLRNLQTSIQQTLSSPQTGSATDLKVLSQIGISLQTDGTLAIDSTTLNNALSTNLAGVAKLFSGAGGTSGYGNQLSTLVTGMTSSGGVLQAAQAGVNTTLKQLGDQYTAMSARVDDTVARYRTQFQQLDVLMSSMNSTMSYLTQQFNAMNGTSSSK